MKAAYPVTGHCLKCGGAVFYRRRLFGVGEPVGPWLHLHDTDWQDNPHQVEPDALARMRLAEAIAAGR